MQTQYARNHIQYVTGASIHAPIHITSTYVHMVRLSIYDTILLEHPHSPIRLYHALGNNSWVNFTIFVSQPSDVRSKIQEHHANGNLISFCLMFFFFVILLYVDDIIILVLRD